MQYFTYSTYTTYSTYSAYSIILECQPKQIELKTNAQRQGRIAFCLNAFWLRLWSGGDQRHSRENSTLMGLHFPRHFALVRTILSKTHKNLFRNFGSTKGKFWPELKSHCFDDNTHQNTNSYGNDAHKTEN